MDAVHRCIEATFAQKDVTLYEHIGTIRTYTRNIDYHDFEYLWMVNSPFQDEAWFMYYIKQWRFIDVNEDTGVIYTDEDILKTWTDRPTFDDMRYDRDASYWKKRRK